MNSIDGQPKFLLFSPTSLCCDLSGFIDLRTKSIVIISYHHQKYGVLGFVLLAFYFLVNGISYYFAIPIVIKYGPKKMICIGSLITLYVLLLKACVASILRHICFLLLAQIKIMDFAPRALQEHCSLLWHFLEDLDSLYEKSLRLWQIALAGQKEYRRLCNDDQEENKGTDIFTIIYGFSTILGTLFALSLTNTNNVRIGLYIILTLLVANALVIQICNQTLTIYIVLPATAKQYTTEEKDDSKEVIKV